MTRELDLSRRKALAALGTIGATSVGAGLGTSAFFSDQETFDNDQMTAGELDMKVGWEEHYSDWSEDEAEHAHMEDGDLVIDDQQGLMNATLQEQFPDKQTKKELDAGDADPCEVLVDVPDDLQKPVIELTDITPGDRGKIIFDFTLCDNPGYVWLSGRLLNNEEVSVTEPESKDPIEDNREVLSEQEVDQRFGDPDGRGELMRTLQTQIWYDENCDGIRDTDEKILFGGPLAATMTLLGQGSGLPLNGRRTTNFTAVTNCRGLAIPAAGDAENRKCYTAAPDSHCLGFRWWVPVDQGNEIQSDSVSFELGFHATQCRHNTGRGIRDIIPEDVATAFVDQIDDSPEAIIYLAGPVSPGAIMTEASTVIDADTAVLEVPETSGTYYLAFIDREPGMEFPHPVRYAWFDTDSSNMQAVEASWQPQIIANGSQLYFEFAKPRVINGQTVALSTRRIKYLAGSNTNDPPVYVVGRVVDKNDEPIPNAPVRIHRVLKPGEAGGGPGNLGDLNVQTTTDSNGIFALKFGVSAEDVPIGKVDGTVIACGERVHFRFSGDTFARPKKGGEFGGAVKSPVQDPNAVLDSVGCALTGGPLPGPPIGSDLPSLTNSATAAYGVIKMPCVPGPPPIDYYKDVGGPNSDYSVRCSTKVVEGTFDDERQFKYSVRNDEKNNPITDFKLCFPSNAEETLERCEGEIEDYPDGWTYEFNDKCIKFFAEISGGNPTNPIKFKEVESFEIWTDTLEEKHIGIVRTTVSRGDNIDPETDTCGPVCASLIFGNGLLSSVCELEDRDKNDGVDV